jgi:hypothetical protein
MSAQIVFTNNTDSASRRPSYAGATTADVLVWGAQLETGSAATAYQRVTDQYNVTEAGVSSVNYLFFDGVNDSLATPSINFPAGPTNPTLGAELVTNGDFSQGSTGWTLEAGWTISGGAASSTVAGSKTIYQTVSNIVAGRTYRVSYSATGATVNAIRINIRTPGDNFQTDYINLNGTVVLYFTSTVSGALGLFCFAAGVTIDNISVREIDAAYAPDKMTVFAGVRKLSDAASGMVTELSSDLNTNNGTFYLIAPVIAGATRSYGFVNKGTTLATAFLAGNTLPAPITNVLTGIGDISGDVTTLRTNGTQAAAVTTDQGTGNYGNYPLYIGHRFNNPPTTPSSVFFSGHLYSLIVRGAQSDSKRISSTETWVASKTGIKI